MQQRHGCLQGGEKRKNDRHKACRFGGDGEIRTLACCYTPTAFRVFKPTVQEQAALGKFWSYLTSAEAQKWAKIGVKIPFGENSGENKIASKKELFSMSKNKTEDYYKTMLDVVFV